MLTYIRYNIQTIVVIAVDLSNAVPIFDNTAVQNVKIVGCACAFDNFGIIFVLFVGYWLDI
ncbi:hypothetical protein SDC9_63843 [bioreactor metagenome]|uniref:Uncharacterized protein n=1 Tax=bioreactor metagenome TaxID=1076179 RepID=A0A644XT41_9ZZZZ